MLICPPVLFLKVAAFCRPTACARLFWPMLMVAALVKVAEEPVFQSPLLFVPPVKRSMLICPPVLLLKMAWL